MEKTFDADAGDAGVFCWIYEKKLYISTHDKKIEKILPTP